MRKGQGKKKKKKKRNGSLENIFSLLGIIPGEWLEFSFKPFEMSSYSVSAER